MQNLYQIVLWLRDWLRESFYKPLGHGISCVQETSNPFKLMLALGHAFDQFYTFLDLVEAASLPSSSNGTSRPQLKAEQH
eukprot:s992_g11.t1